MEKSSIECNHAADNDQKLLVPNLFQAGTNYLDYIEAKSLKAAAHKQAESHAASWKRLLLNSQKSLKRLATFNGG